MEEREERAQRLKRLKRKRIYTVTALCVLLAGLIFGYYLITERNEKRALEEARKKEQNQVETQETEITGFLLNEVASVEFSNEEESYHFVWTESENYGAWIRQGEEDFPTDGSKVQTIINQFCGLTGTAKMAAGDVDLEDYGLQDTEYRVTLTLTDGTKHRFLLGDEAPYESGHYLLYENTQEIFVVSSTIQKQLATKEIKLVLAETFPSAEPESMTELRIEVRDGETVSYVPEKQEDGSSVYPPIFYDSVRFVASTVQEYHCTDFAKYGLEDPYVTVTIDYLGYVMDENGAITREPSTMVAEIGDRTVSGNYYVRINGSDFVYIMMETHAKKYLPQ